jgi:hypothetical protein
MCFYISRPSRSHFRSRTPFHTRSRTRSHTRSHTSSHTPTHTRSHTPFHTRSHHTRSHTRSRSFLALPEGPSTSQRLCAFVLCLLG